MRQLKKPFKYMIMRIINNNVVTSRNALDAEVVLMGKGISFQKKAGDCVETSAIEKMFVLKGKEKNRFLELAEDIPPIYMDIALQIVEIAELDLKCKLNPMVYIMLADHIFCAVERKHDGLEFHNELLNEIKRYYPEEFRVGKKSLEIIRDLTSEALSMDEAGFISLHLINAMGKKISTDSVKRVRLINEILEIVEGCFGIKLDAESIYYERFLTHLKYFAARAFRNEIEKNNDDFVYRMVKTQYPKAANCVELIGEHINSDYGLQITDEEKGYLIVHICILLKRRK